MLEVLSDDLVPGVIVAGRYELVRIVGEGGMGVVWAARHVLTEKACALKFLKESRAADPKSHARLLREARAVCAVRHPNVAQVHDILELPSGVPFIVMDLLEGEALSARLAERGALSASEVRRILLAIIDAVAAAHALGIVHRDLKPDNVFLERSPTGEELVKVLDFGIAKREDSAAARPEGESGSSASIDRITEASLRVAGTSGMTSTFSVLGTPVYMAPEQLEPGAVVDARADIWALGIIAYECLIGERPPLLDDDASRIAALSLSPDVPPALARIVGRMLRKRADERPSLAEVQEAISAETPVKVRGQWRRRAGWVAAGALLAGVVAGPIRSWRSSDDGGAVVQATHPRPTTSVGQEPLPVATAPVVLLPSTPSSSSSAITMPANVTATAPPSLPSKVDDAPRAIVRPPSSQNGAPAPRPPSSAATPPDDLTKIPTYERQ
jgi:serine/threonine-protein kinase